MAAPLAIEDARTVKNNRYSLADVLSWITGLAVCATLLRELFADEPIITHRALVVAAFGVAYCTVELWRKKFGPLLAFEMCLTVLVLLAIADRGWRVFQS